MSRVRDLCSADLDAALDLAMGYASEYAMPYPIKRECLRTLMVSFASNQRGIALILEDDSGAVGGFLFAMVAPSPFNDEVLTAMEGAVFVRPDLRGGRGGAALLLAYLKRAKAMGAAAVEVARNFVNSPAHMGEKLEAMGFRALSCSYLKEL